MTSAKRRRAERAAGLVRGGQGVVRGSPPLNPAGILGWSGVSAQTGYFRQNLIGGNKNQNLLDSNDGQNHHKDSFSHVRLENKPDHPDQPDQARETAASSRPVPLTYPRPKPTEPRPTAKTDTNQPDEAHAAMWRDMTIVVQDLLAEGKRPWQIRRMFGLTFGEIERMRRARATGTER